MNQSALLEAEFATPIRVEVGEGFEWLCRILIDGEDVTPDCYAADECAGMVELAVNERITPEGVPHPKGR